MDFAVIEKFILVNYPISQTWGDSLSAWIKWAAFLGFLTLVYDSPESRKLIGLAVSRPMSEVDSYIEKTIKHDKSGRFIWIDLLIAPTKQIFQSAAIGILALMGEGKRKVAYMRRGKFKIHDIESASAALLRTR